VVSAGSFVTAGGVSEYHVIAQNVADGSRAFSVKINAADGVQKTKSIVCSGNNKFHAILKTNSKNLVYAADYTTSPY